LTGQTGPLGKSALLAHQIWEGDINASGGLLGRRVKLVYYDNQSNPATVPGIYTKLLDADKVELNIGPFGTNLVAPALPVALQKNKLIIGLFANSINSEFKYPKYFSMTPNGPSPKVAIRKGFFDVAMEQNPRRGRSRSLRLIPNLPGMHPMALARTPTTPVSRSSTIRPTRQIRQTLPRSYAPSRR
jgi:branched-chain amino acid transport system substrate-binding protein